MRIVHIIPAHVAIHRHLYELLPAIDLGKVTRNTRPSQLIAKSAATKHHIVSGVRGISPAHPRRLREGFSCARYSEVHLPGWRVVQHETARSTDPATKPS